MDDMKHSNNGDVDYKIIKNPYIILVGICNYDDATNKPLPKVKQDIKNMEELWSTKYKYATISNITKVISTKLENISSKITVEQDIIKNIPSNYKPSLSTGIYGSYSLKTLTPSCEPTLNQMTTQYKPSLSTGVYGMYALRTDSIENKMPLDYKPSLSTGIYGLYSLKTLTTSYKPSLSTGVYGVYMLKNENNSAHLKEKIEIINESNYKPSLSTGVYGVYMLKNNDNELCDLDEKKEIIEESEILQQVDEQVLEQKDEVQEPIITITAETLRSFLNEECKKMDENVDGLIFIYSGYINTNGLNNFIICDDNNYISFNDIQCIFSSDQYINLKNKPKILYFNGYKSIDTQPQKCVVENNKYNDFFIHYQINDNSCLIDAIYNCYMNLFDKLEKNMMTLNDISMKINRNMVAKNDIEIINRLKYDIYIHSNDCKTTENTIKSRGTLINLLYVQNKQLLIQQKKVNEYSDELTQLKLYVYNQEKQLSTQEQQIIRLSKDVIHKDKQLTSHSEELLKLKRKSNIFSDKWKKKDINEWTTDELEGWIISLNLGTKHEALLITQIRSEEIRGEDINSCESSTEIIDSFEGININTGNKIFQNILQIRKNSKSYQNKNNNLDYFDDDSKYNDWILNDSSKGIIGLNNLGNTCFINSVIQCLLQTPPLIQVLRNWSSKRHWWGSSSNMLDSFIDVAQAAMQSSAKHRATAPSGIVSSLRNSDVRFERGAQGDALSAVSKMIELLDRGIINRQKSNIKPITDVINHPGSWYYAYIDEDGEDESIIGNLINYNPYKSVVREKMHFIERCILYCMNPGCNYSESRYEFKEKVLLPLHDHAININLDIYIPSISYRKIIKIKRINVLTYCSIDTLRHEIYKQVSNVLKYDNDNDDDSKNDFTLQYINQIKIKMMKINRYGNIKDWIQDIYVQDECKCLLSDNTYIFALIESIDMNDSDFMVSTFNIFIDENGKINCNKSFLNFNEMKEGDKISLKLNENIKVNGYKKNIYFKGILFDEYNEEFVDEYNKIIICIWIDNKFNKNLTINNIERKVYNAFINKQNTNNLYNNKNNGVQNDICGAFSVYLSDKILDRGAVLKCVECGKKSDVFKVETKIVRYPEILIFAIDRYINGRKFTETVDYSHILKYDKGYELYGVCNHSGSLSGGHYWAYVKGVDDGNWYNANDSHIGSMNPSSVINRASAIILMYKRLKKY